MDIHSCTQICCRWSSLDLISSSAQCSQEIPITHSTSRNRPSRYFGSRAIFYPSLSGAQIVENWSFAGMQARCLLSPTSLHSSRSSTSRRSEKPFATVAGCYVTSRADPGTRPPLLGNRADSLSAFQQQLLLWLHGFTQYREPAKEHGEVFLQTASAPGG